MVDLRAYETRKLVWGRGAGDENVKLAVIFTLTGEMVVGRVIKV